MVGAGLYNNQSVGMLILTAQAISCIMIGIVYNIACGLRHSSPHKRTEDDIRHTAIARSHDAFVTAAADTASTMLGMCSFIILFQVITSVLDAAGINQALGRLSQSAHFGDTGEYLLPCITEVTGGSIISVKAGLPLTAFVMGFGGLSVHFQNFALCRTIRPRKWLYILTRLVQGILCSLLVSLALRLPCFASVSVPAAKTVIDSVPAEFSQVSTGFGCTMLVMCLMSVICLPQSRKESY